ncbi:RmlC-like cupins superfamily protein [Prunus dulcis]|uniref:RmlC-like cupins superfamily protein n=1 Tax=Prunus dulcis TaxID=3755 RepID=A0A4Y1QY18_PRUDU|nr:RmlC-like cupins superfamily protein [Prunus dulcis]
MTPKASSPSQPQRVCSIGPFGRSLGDGESGSKFSSPVTESNSQDASLIAFSSYPQCSVAHATLLLCPSFLVSNFPSN